MVTSNPLLKRDESFAGVGSSVMTLNGTVNKTGILFLICIATAYFGWTMPELHGGFMYIALFAGLAFALIGVFKPVTSPVVAPLYAASEGLVLGAISQYFNARFPGVAPMAVIATFSVLGGFLFLYATRIVQMTRGFAAAIVAGTIGVLAVVSIGLVMSFFGHTPEFLYGSSPLAIGFSVVVCIIAALNFFLDFAAIEGYIRGGAPKYMEWYSGLALMITMVWLYLRVLRLLSQLQNRR